MLPTATTDAVGQTPQARQPPVVSKSQFPIVAAAGWTEERQARTEIDAAKKPFLLEMKTRTARISKGLEGAAAARTPKVEKMVGLLLHKEVDRRRLTEIIDRFKRRLIDLQQKKADVAAETAAYMATLPEEMRDLSPENEHWFLKDRADDLNASLAGVEGLRAVVQDKGLATSAVASWLDRRLHDAHRRHLCDAFPIEVLAHLSAEEVAATRKAGLQALESLSGARADWRRSADAGDLAEKKTVPTEETNDLLELEKRVVVTSGALTAFRILHRAVAARCAGLSAARGIANERVETCYALLAAAITKMEREQVRWQSRTLTLCIRRLLCPPVDLNVSVKLHFLLFSGENSAGAWRDRIL